MTTPHTKPNPTPMIAGTEYFISFTAAVQYYAPYGYDKKDIQKKIAGKEIQIGKPFLKSNQELIVRDSRYWVQSN